VCDKKDGREGGTLAVGVARVMRALPAVHETGSRPRLRVLVKRILSKYGYPPDLEDDAVRGVLARAEAILAELFLFGLLK
jgi:hypothetical protein